MCAMIVVFGERGRGSRMSAEDEAIHCSVTPLGALAEDGAFVAFKINRSLSLSSSGSEAQNTAILPLF